MSQETYTREQMRRVFSLGCGIGQLDAIRPTMDIEENERVIQSLEFPLEHGMIGEADRMIDYVASTEGPK